MSLQSSYDVKKARASVGQEIGRTFKPREQLATKIGEQAIQGCIEFDPTDPCSIGGQRLNLIEIGPFD